MAERRVFQIQETAHHENKTWNNYIHLLKFYNNDSTMWDDRI